MDKYDICAPAKHAKAKAYEEFIIKLIETRGTVIFAERVLMFFTDVNYTYGEQLERFGRIFKDHIEDDKDPQHLNDVLSLFPQPNHGKTKAYEELLACAIWTRRRWTPSLQKSEKELEDDPTKSWKSSL